MMLGKALRILHTLGEAEARGLQAAQIAEATGMHRVTLHRFLRSLDREGLIERDEARFYHLGLQVWRLGMAANRRFDVLALAGGALERIEAESHDTIYLLRRVGDNVFCVARRDGRYPIKSLVMEVGGSYPLGVGGGGLAVLAALDPAETRGVLQRLPEQLALYPQLSMTRIRKLLADTRKQGYAFWPALISEAFVVAVPILDSEQRPIGALSCAAIKERLDPKRRLKVVSLLRAEADGIGRRMAGERTAVR